MRYPHIFSRLYNAPLMLSPDRAATIESAFRAHLTSPISRELLQDSKKQAETNAVTGRKDSAYAVTPGGIAIIPVMGALVQRASAMDSLCGMTSYSSISDLFTQAIADPSVRGILLDVDSGGGEVSGVFDLADQIYAARATKLVWAVADEQAYSAAYAIASSASKLYLPRTGGIGSIGVIAMHIDQSAKNAKAGLTYTAITAGAKKADLSSHAPLSDTAKTDLQTEIDRLYDLFANTVARNRGIDADAIKSTEAGLMNPDQAIAGGFADGIATLQETIDLMEFELSALPGSTVFSTSASHAGLTKEVTMTQQNPAAPQADATASPAAVPTDRINALRAEGAQAERARISAILTCAEAEGRGAMASTFALETDIDPATAQRLLAKSPMEATATAPQNPLHAAMAGVPNPRIGADVSPEANDSPESQAMSLAMQVINAGKQAAIHTR